MPREVRYCRPRSQPAESLLAHLSTKYTYLSAADWTHHIAEGHVWVNGTVALNEGYVLQQGDKLRFAPPRSLEPPVDEENIDVLYDDDAMVVCAKNGNIPVAEGGRYCENTLVAVLQRRGIAAFCSAHTVRAVAPIPQAAREDGSADPLTVRSSSGSDHPEKVAIPTKNKRPREENQHASSAMSGSTAIPPTPLLTVQRLDKETSGVLVLCKDASTAKTLSSQLESQSRACTAAVEARVALSQDPFTSSEFEALLAEAGKTVSKTYAAVLLGSLPVGETFVVVDWMDTVQSHPLLSVDPAHAQLKRLKMCSEALRPTTAQDGAAEADGKKPHRWGKVACTRLRVVASSAALNLSCVQVDLLTGRSHQIRVHAASVGHAVVGDKLYESTHASKAEGCRPVPDDVYLARVRSEEDAFCVLADNGMPDGRRMWCRRHLLHSHKLVFQHPWKDGAGVMSFTASPVDFFQRDVRFEAAEDAQAFHDLLESAFAE